MLKKLLLAVSVGLFASLAQATPNDPPEQIVRNVSREVLETIKKYEKDTVKMREQVDAQVSPLADYPRMTSLAVGMPWRTASAEQKQALSIEFRQMLVRTYLSALTIYKNAEVEVKGVRAGNSPSEQTVRTEVSLPDQKPIPVDFKFEKNANGWKVYDITVEGISFINNHRNQFKAVIQKDGIDGLIKSLSDRNAAARGK